MQNGDEALPRIKSAGRGLLKRHEFKLLVVTIRDVIHCISEQGVMQTGSFQRML